MSLNSQSSQSASNADLHPSCYPYPAQASRGSDHKFQHAAFILALAFGILWAGNSIFAQDTANQRTPQNNLDLRELPGASAKSVRLPQSLKEIPDSTAPAQLPFQPLESLDQLAGKPPLCRFGVNHVMSTVYTDITTIDLVSLRTGWYIDYRTLTTTIHPNGIQHAQVIRIYPSNTITGYTYYPSGADLIQAVQNNQGQDWFVGNEPDRHRFQDGVLPTVYARAYHELYQIIKANDPTAQLFAGSIVQATPMRLLYLDLILQSYQQQFGTSMPVDGWSIHNFILNEVDCFSVNNDLNKCWGAELPLGITATTGLIVSINQNDDFALFTEQLVRFRQWMAANGYRDRPLYLSEYGVLMPSGFGYTEKRVSTFMSKTFDYMLNTTDADIGYPADDNRLVQRFSWYSTNHDDNYNGYLYKGATANLPIQLTEMGKNYISYTQSLSETVDFVPLKVSMTSYVTSPNLYNNLYNVSAADAQAITMTLNAEIANSGNTLSQTVTVRFFNGDPAAGGVQIGSDRTVMLEGCGDRTSVQTQWTDAAGLGAYTIYVQVDPVNTINESNENNNLRSGSILVASNRVLLPYTSR